MTTFLLLFLMIFTIGAAFVLGIVLSYWLICGILNFFNRSDHRLDNQPANDPIFATISSGG
jgi:hypothetical protein